MRIVTHGPGEWAVIGEWYGAERTLKRGSIWDCITFAYNNRDWSLYPAILG